VKCVKVRFRAIGQWEPPDVLVQWVGDRRPRIAEIDRVIQQAWEEARRRPGLNLFDGPMCRLERLVAGPKLQLELSPTSYKIFWGTNLHNAWLSLRHGPEALANAVGLSCALESADGFLTLGRRSPALAYYPSRVHPFAGTLEPIHPLDLFAEMRRELAEELRFDDADVPSIWCAGVIEDVSIGQPELVFSAKSSRTRSDIERMLDAAEHEACLAIEPDREKLESSLSDPAMTPVALGVMLLWGRERFGQEWFDAAEHAVNLGGHESS
jgi:hypothetical protein